LGGAIMNDNGTFAISDSVFLHNRAIGGFGGGFPGAVAAGGAIANIALFGDANLSVSHSTLIDNRAMGGAPGTGSTAQIAKGGGMGGGVFNGVPNPFGTPSLTLLHSLVALNQAEGGAAGVGGSAGLGQGGGVYATFGGTVSADLGTAILANDASTSDDDVFGV